MMLDGFLILMTGGLVLFLAVLYGHIHDWLFSLESSETYMESNLSG